MNIPNSFKLILEKDQKLLGIVNSTISKFEPIINSSRYTFFEEYTDHGVSHLETVLSTAEWLIEDSINLLNSKDIAVLVLSVFLHDLGMHISYDGLVNLIHSDLKNNKIDCFNEQDWNQEWENFFQEAKKWNEKKLKSVFGKVINIKEPPKDEEEATSRDKKLYGEFLRRNHPRLAHEISIYGFPGKNDEVIPFINECDDELIGLSGLVARSHGIEIRDTFDYLKKSYTKGWRTPYDIKIIYLMVVIRIADYLHITSERTSPIVLKQRRLSSPYSEAEHNLHKSIKFINRDDDDPETLYVQSKPESSLIYIKLSNLLKNIQNELDSSWAVLGEAYGRFGELKSLGISIRRIKSNIDNIEWLYNNVDYIPQSVHFDADPELIKLLIAPLYGDNPSYGVRELVQNAVDACHEREYLISQKGLDIKEYNPTVEISIEIKDNKKYFIIKDNGIGMNENTLVNYFFKAGASFRNNKNWIDKFTSDDGKSKIQRSGRFGVGMLAAFLLGNEIYVSTKNVHSQWGYEFNADVESEQIEIKKIHRDSGTTIRIDISDKIYDILESQAKAYRNSYDIPTWDQWYKFERPQLIINYPDEWKRKYVTKSSFTKPNCEASKCNDIECMDYKLVQWSYKQKYNSESYYDSRNNGELLCNGIIISKWNHNFKRI